MKNGWNSFGSSSGVTPGTIVLHFEPDLLAGVEHADQDAPACAPADSIACCALMTKFSITCSISVKFAYTLREVVISTSSAIDEPVEIAAAKLDDFADDVAQVHGRRRPGLLAAEAREVADDLARAAALRLDERDFVERLRAELAVALEELGGAENRLQRVVQLVRDARHQHADRGQAFLADDLPLQRLQRFAHLALLFDLPIERVVRFAQIGRHRGERVLQLGELEVGHGGPRRRREIAAGDLRASRGHR